MVKRQFLCLIFMLGVASPSLVSAEPETRMSPFSGKPVPRFESLKYTLVNGRTGPSLDYPIAWQYEREGLPVLIVKESPDWRQVQDPEGTKVWIHARMLSERRTAIVRQDTALRRSSDVEAREIAIVQAGVVVEVLQTNGTQLKVRTDKYSGWIESTDIWGHTPGPQS